MTDAPAKPISLVDCFDQADLVACKLRAVEFASIGALVHDSGVETGAKVEAIEALCTETREAIQKLVAMLGAREHKPEESAP